MPPSTFAHCHRVSFAECTVGNHVYYARFLDILEETRGELFRLAGVPLLRMQAEGFMFPVIECRLQYRAAARYDDLLHVDTWVTELRAARLTLAYRVNREPNQPILDATIRHICTSLEEKPRRMPPYLIASLQPFMTVGATSYAPLNDGSEQ